MTAVSLPLHQTQTDGTVQDNWQAPTGFRMADIGIIPLLLSLPLLYFPKVLDGDTQLWVLGASLIALLTFRTEKFILKSEFWLSLLCFACVVVYALRVDLEPSVTNLTGAADFLRTGYTQVAFMTFWIISRREGGQYFGWAVRFTIVVWLLVALYQYVAIRTGLPVEFTGRFVPGRSGVPSLTSEPAAYGSLSVLHMMYLLAERKRQNGPFIAAAAVSVVLSGSLLALLLLPFPLMKMPQRIRVLAALTIPLAVFLDYTFSSAGVAARLGTFNHGLNVYDLLRDPSLNLRAGHIVFTLVENFWNSVLLLQPVSFMQDYNEFAMKSGLFIRTGSNAILPSIGAVIYDYGIFGIFLLVAVLRGAAKQTSTPKGRLEKLAFIIACLLNPIALSNPFLIMYAQKKN